MWSIWVVRLSSAMIFGFYASEVRFYRGCQAEHLVPTMVSHSEYVCDLLPRVALAKYVIFRHALRHANRYTQPIQGYILPPWRNTRFLASSSPSRTSAHAISIFIVEPHPLLTIPTISSISFGAVVRFSYPDSVIKTSSAATLAETQKRRTDSAAHLLCAHRRRSNTDPAPPHQYASPAPDPSDTAR